MANVDALLQQGIAAIKAGNRAEARKVLEQVVEVSDQNEQAWLWLSACVDSLQDQKTCLENVLALNPNNAKARKGLEAVNQQLSAASPPSTANKPAPFGDNYDPFAINDPYSDPTAAWGSQFETPATSVDWNRGSAPAYGSGKSVKTPSPEEYDSWMANLPLGTPTDTDPIPAFNASVEPPKPAFDSDFDPFSGPFSVPSTADNDDLFGSSFSKDPFARSKAGPGPFDAPPTKTPDPFDFGDANSVNTFDSNMFDSPNTFNLSTDDLNAPAQTASDNSATSAERFQFGGAKPSSNNSTFSPFSNTRADAFSNRRSAAELPGSSDLFRKPSKATGEPLSDIRPEADPLSDDPILSDYTDDLFTDKAGIFGGGKADAKAGSPAKVKLPMANAAAFKDIPPEIKAGGMGRAQAGMLLILLLFNIASLVVLVLNLKS